MNSKTLKKLLEEKQQLRILDVREADEFEAGEKIPIAENTPMGRIFSEAAKGNLPKDQKIITVCKSGTRCEIVAKELRQRGFDIEALEGGIDAWKENENTNDGT